MNRDGAEDMMKVVLDLKKEVAEMRQLLSIIADAVFESDYYEEPDVDIGELRKLILDNRNMYN